MKKASEIYNEIAPDAEGELHSMDYERVIDAMKAYAEHAIDQCAEDAEMIVVRRGTAVEIDTGSIINVKTKLL